MSNDSIDSSLSRARQRTSVVEATRVTNDKDNIFEMIDFQILRTKMHASTYKYKTLEITHGWTGPIRIQKLD